MNTVTVHQSVSYGTRVPVAYRRASKRIAPPTGLTVTSVNGDTPKVVNISAEGMLIHSAATYLEGRTHEFILRIDDHSSTVRARVVHASTFRSGSHSVLVGLEFARPLGGHLQMALGLIG